MGTLACFSQRIDIRAGRNRVYRKSLTSGVMGYMHVDKAAMRAMETRYRVAFINSLSGFKSANLIGTVDGRGQTNVSIASSCVHLGADPALLAFVVRPHSVDRHTLENLIETGFYTINHVHQDFYRKAHQTSARYAKSESEFEATGLTPVWRGEFGAPYVEEAAIGLGMVFCEQHSLKINGTELIIGEIQDVWVPDACVSPDGFVDLERAGSVCVSGLDSYHQTRRLSRLSYAKPGVEPTVIS